MSLLIRRLGPGDERVLALLAEQAPAFDLPGVSESEPPLPPAAAAGYLAQPDVLHWVAQDGEQIVGELLCHLLRMPSRAGHELLLYSIGVRQSRRRRGVGTALVAEMLRWMAEAGVGEVWVLADNPEAEAFYEACGFRRGADNDQGVLMLLDVETA